MEVIIGIDIGISGAIAVMDVATGEIIKIVAIPIIAMELKTKKKNGKPKIRHTYDKMKILVIFTKFKRDYTIYDVCIERPLAIPAQTILTATTAFEGFGFLQGLMHGLYLPNSAVVPLVWTKALLGAKIKKGKGESPAEFKKRKKRRSIEKAKEIFPEATEMIGNNDNFADAALIAEWKFNETRRK